MAATDDMFELGRTLKPHGLKGEVAIKLDVDVPKHYASLDMVWVERQGTLVPYSINSISIRPKTTVVQFDGRDDVDAAAALSVTGCCFLSLLCLALTGLQFYYHEVVGFCLDRPRYGLLGHCHCHGPPGQSAVQNALNGKRWVLSHKGRDLGFCGPGHERPSRSTCPKAFPNCISLTADVSDSSSAVGQSRSHLNRCSIGHGRLLKLSPALGEEVCAAWVRSSPSAG